MWLVLAGLTEFSSNYCSNCLRKWSIGWRGNRTPRLRIIELSDDNTFVIPSNARDLGSCLHDRFLHRRQVPRSLELLGMTILLCKRSYCLLFSRSCNCSADFNSFSA